MMATTLSYIDKKLPFVVFSVVSAVGVHCMSRHLYHTDLVASVHGHCPTMATVEKPYRLNYTGLYSVDVALCALVAFFQDALEPQPLPFMKYALAMLAELVFIPLVEAERRDATSWTSHPALFFALYQLCTVGASIPWYWIGFLYSGMHRIRGVSGGIERSRAESAVFAFVVGAVIPTAAMYLFNDAYATAIWQAFPIWVFVAQRMYAQLRGSASPKPRSGYALVQVTHALIFLFSIVLHYATVYPAIAAEKTGLGETFVPSYSLDSLSKSSVLQSATDFFKWDLGFGIGATILATLWYGSGAAEVFGLLAWSVFGSLLFSPGAALAGTAMWRERRIRNS